MNVGKIMRRDVTPLGAGDPIEAAWRQMHDQNVGALPVTDGTGHLVGVLTEHDLLGRVAPRRERPWWTAIFAGTDRLAADYVKAAGLTVGDLMTAAPAAIAPEASVETVATLMRRHAIPALPVVADDRCIGLVTRADVLDWLSWPAAPASGAVTDADVAASMQARIHRERWTARHRVAVEAVRGVIRLTGVVTSPLERSGLLVMARSVPGYAGVEDRLVVLGGHGRRRPARII
jgi:CBS domain-containing protein